MTAGYFSNKNPAAKLAELEVNGIEVRKDEDAIMDFGPPSPHYRTLRARPQIQFIPSTSGRPETEVYKSVRGRFSEPKCIQNEITSLFHNVEVKKGRLC